MLGSISKANDMYLTIKYPDSTTKELRFRTGPIYVGRQLGSQVFLPDSSVSRQHAVIYSTKAGKWVLEDLDSANKTYLNGIAIHKSEIKDGDSFTVSGFTVEISFQKTVSLPRAINMEETLVTVYSEERTIVRKINGHKSESIKVSSQDLEMLYNSNVQLCFANSKNELLEVIVKLLEKQFGHLHIWVGLRKEQEEFIEMYNGKSSKGTNVTLDSLVLKSYITEAMDKKEFTLFPRVVTKTDSEKIRSAMIAPIVFDNQSVGVIYIDNTLSHEPFDVKKLNYLIFLTASIGLVVQKF